MRCYSVAALLIWQAAMCAYTDKLQADTASGACIDAGACARLDEQPERMCEPEGGRADQILTACAAGDLQAARTYNAYAAASWYHHVGLAAAYVRSGKMSVDLFREDMGDPATADPRAFASLTAAKVYLRERAQALGEAQAAAHPLLVVPRALSGYGKTLRWQAVPNPCVDD